MQTNIAIRKRRGKSHDPARPTEPPRASGRPSLPAPDPTRPDPTRSCRHSPQSMPSWRATASAVVRSSPVSMTTWMPSARRLSSAAREVGLMKSATAMMLPALPFKPTNRAVAPELRSSGQLTCPPHSSVPSATGARRPLTAIYLGSCEASPCRCARTSAMNSDASPDLTRCAVVSMSDRNAISGRNGRAASPSRLKPPLP